MTDNQVEWFDNLLMLKEAELSMLSETFAIQLQIPKYSI